MLPLTFRAQLRLKDSNFRRPAGGGQDPEISKLRSPNGSEMGGEGLERLY